MQRCRVKDLDLYCLSPAEARLLHEDLFGPQTYFAHGIEVRDGDVVFDVGANIGLFCIQVQQKAPLASIHAFEPIPPIREVLVANVELHRVNAKVHAVALSQSNGTAQFAFYPANAALSGAYVDPAADKELARAILTAKNAALAPMLDGLLEGKFDATPFTCELRRLSDVVREEKLEKIDLLKIDVEKAELDVVRGIDDADWPKIRQIVVEVHDIDGRLATMTELFGRHGFRVAKEQHDPFRGTGIWDVYAIRE